MSQGNVEVVRRGMEQFNQDFTSDDLNLDLLAPDIVFDNSNAGLDAAVYRGHDGMRELMSLLRGMWKLQQGQAQEFIPVDEDRVIVPVRIVSVGREIQSKAEALEAVGLSE